MVKINRVKVLKLFFVLIFISTSLFASIATLKKATLKKGELRLSFNQAYNKSSIKVSNLKNPARKVFYIRDAKLKNKNIDKNLKSSYCRSIHISQYKKNVIRIVLEVDKNYVCTAYRPMFSYMSYHIPLPKSKSRKKSVYNKRTKSKKVKKSVKVREISSSKAINESYIVPTKDSRRGVVVLDAGHGGIDSGASRGKRKEKDLVLKISKYVKNYLNRLGYTVYMTRDSDKTLKLTQRTKMADKKKANVFVSIHGNAIEGRRVNKVQGVETYFLQNTRDARSQKIAARENRSVLMGAGSKLSKKVILDSVLSGPKIVESNKLAISVQRRMITNLYSRYKSIKDRGVRHAPFYVLVGASRPSILVEVGYISHPTEIKRLFTVAYQKLIAKGIAQGIDIYLNNRKNEIEF